VLCCRIFERFLTQEDLVVVVFLFNEIYGYFGIEKYGLVLYVEVY